MPIRISRFEMPKRVVMDEETATETYGRFTAEPFEVGYGRTIGNSLRRVLLSSIEGVAITSVNGLSFIPLMITPAICVTVNASLGVKMMGIAPPATPVCERLLFDVSSVWLIVSPN